MGVGIITASAILLIGISASAFLSHRGMLNLSVLHIIAKAVYAVAVTNGCWLAAKRAEKAKMLCAGETGAFCFFLLAGICEAASKIPTANLGWTGALTICAILIGGALGARRKRSRYV